MTEATWETTWATTWAAPPTGPAPAGPSPSWPGVEVRGRWLHPRTGEPAEASWVATIPRVASPTDGVILRPGVLAAGTLTGGVLRFVAPQNDDADITPRGWPVRVEVRFVGRGGVEVYQVFPQAQYGPTGIDLHDLVPVESRP